MSKLKKRSVSDPAGKESDRAYFLKIVLYLILGSLWLKIGDGQTYQIPVPIGLLVGLIFTAHEHFQIDRKIEYAVLLLSMFLGFWLPYAIYYSHVAK